MRALSLVVLIALSGSCLAQESRREVTHAADPAQDHRPNSKDVPAVAVTASSLKRVVILRLKFGTDLLAGIRNAVAEQKIKNAVILSGFGSVRNYQVHQVANRDLPVKEIFVQNPDAPADILSMSGMIADGRVHAHITMADANKAFGGHLEPDTQVYTFAIVTLGVLDDSADMSKFDDWTVR